MRRREFLAASTTAAVALISAKASIGAENSSNRQFFELRTYHFASAQKQQAYEQFMKDAAIPAYNRAGVEPVGVWKLTAKDNAGNRNMPKTAEGEDPALLYVFLPHNSFDSVLHLEHQLAADQQFQKAGAAVLNSPRNDPAYTRFESTLLWAMEGATRVTIPSKSPDRVFELRTYQSRNEERAANKLEMFNKGEFPLFAASGMPGVFFGGAIVGQDLPQLTYMIVHESLDESKKNWGRFGSNADWKKLQTNQSYKDNVSKVVNLFVRPTGGSQI
jgi:hypothetical protein